MEGDVSRRGDGSAVSPRSSCNSRASLHLVVDTPAATHIDTTTSTALDPDSSASAHSQLKCHNTSAGYAIPIASYNTLSC